MALKCKLINQQLQFRSLEGRHYPRGSSRSDWCGGEDSDYSLANTRTRRTHHMQTHYPRNRPSPSVVNKRHAISHRPANGGEKHSLSLFSQRPTADQTPDKPRPAAKDTRVPTSERQTTDYDSWPNEGKQTINMITDLPSPSKAAPVNEVPNLPSK